MTDLVPTDTPTEGVDQPDPAASIAGPAPTSTRSFQTAQARTGSKPIPFDIDGEVFMAAAEAPGGALLDAAKANEPGVSTLEKVRRVAEFLDAVLLPESAVRFAARFRDAEHPIDLPVAAEIVKWLTAKYANAEGTDRPTEPSSP